MSEKVKSIFLDNTTVFDDNIVDHDLTKSWKTIFGDENPNINSDSLAAYWRFDDNTGKDSSVNTNNISWVSTPTETSETPFKNKNSTILFNGTSNYGTVLDSPELSFGNGTIDQPFSISFWVKVDFSDTSKNYYHIINKLDSTSREYAVMFNNTDGDEDAYIQLSIYDKSSGNQSEQRYILEDDGLVGNPWYHVAFTSAGTTTTPTPTTGPDTALGIKIYLNGLEATSEPNHASGYMAMEATSADLTIGIWGGTGTPEYFKGCLSELAIWNRELTATEVKTLHDVKYGVMSNSFTSYSPRLMLRDADNRRGQYPTVRRTGDKDRSGSFNIQFNDENTVEFKKIPTVYPGEKDQSFSITDSGTSYTYSSQDNLVAHWRPQDAVIPTAAGTPITTPWGVTRFIGGSVPVGGQAYITNRVPGGQIAYVENFAEIYDTDDPRHTGFTERDGKIYETRGARNSYKYLFQDDSDDGLNIGTAATWDAIIGDDTAGGSTEKMSFSMWIKPQDYTSYPRLLDFGDSDIALYLEANKLKFRARRNGTAVRGEWITTSEIPLDAWTHIVVTWEIQYTDPPEIFVNGIAETVIQDVLTLTVMSPFIGIVTDDCYIGNKSNFVNRFNGYIADVAIWNNTLSADEVKALYLNDTRWNPDITSAQEVQYPIGLLKDDSRLPELTPDITSKGLVTRSHGGESFSIITDGEDVSAYNDELDKTQDTDFYNVGTDRDVYPGFSSPLRSKTSFTFDITTTDEQYVFRQTGDANPTGEFPGEDYTGFCYYAFGKNKWEQIGLINPEDGSDRVYAYGIDAGGPSASERPNLSDCGPQSFPMQFTGRAGFSILSNENTPLTLLSANKTVLGYDKIGSPTSTSFAPFGTQYHATSSQTIKVNEFITDPFLLEKITIKLPIEARHLVLSDADKTRDLSNYVAFLYLQRNSKSERVSTSERSIIAASSFCFYNNKVLTDNADTATFPTGEYIPFSPIHASDFSHEFDIDAMVNFDDEITLEFTPEIFNPVKLASNIPNIDDLLGTAVLTPSDFPGTFPAGADGDRLILEDTLGTTHVFTFNGSFGDGTDIPWDAAWTAEKQKTEAALIINATDSFIASYDSYSSLFTIKQARGGSTGATDIRYWDDTAGTSSVIETFSTTTYNARSTAYNMFWPGGSTTLPFTVDGISTYSGKDSDIDLTFATDYDILVLDSMIYGNVYKEYYASVLSDGLTNVLQKARISKPVTRHVKNYGTKIIDPEIEVDAWRTLIHDYFSVKDRSQKTAFVLLPGDELILGIEKTTCGDRIGPGTTSGAFEFGLSSQQSFSGSYIKIKTEPASMTMYGSLIKENKEKHNTINQDLTSNSVHEAFYGDPVLDQFEIEPISMYAGTTRDEYVTGDMFTGINEDLVIGTRDVDKTVSGGDVSDVWSLTRFNKFSDESERYYDTLLPDASDYLKKSSSNYSDMTGAPDSLTWVPLNYQYDTTTRDEFIDETKVFPFELNIQKRTDDSFMIYAWNDVNGDGLIDVTEWDDAATTPDESIIVIPSIYAYMEGWKWLGVGFFAPVFRDGESSIKRMAGQPGGCLGFKHGVRNTTPITTTSTFRSNNYGQFRDMLEQRQYGRFYKTKKFSLNFSNSTGLLGKYTPGSPVERFQTTTVITKGPLDIKFVEENSSIPAVEPRFTRSSNLSAYATSSLPFFDDLDTHPRGRNREYPELTLNTTSLSSNALLDFSFDPSDLS